MMDKAIKYNKEWRRPYRNSKSFDRTCRNNGSCNYCRNNRTYHNRKEDLRINSILSDYLN